MPCLLWGFSVNWFNVFQCLVCIMVLFVVDCFSEGAALCTLEVASSACLTTSLPGSQIVLDLADAALHPFALESPGKW